MIELALLLGVSVALITELLSLFGALGRGGVMMAWLLAAGLVGALAGRTFFRRRAGRAASNPAPVYSPSFWRWVGRWRVGQVQALLLLGGAAVYVLLLLLTALAAPPNTNDSLQYHLSRVAHWAQNGSVQHYATPIERQVWMPPLAEYAVLQLYLLAGDDRLANLVQWAAMLASLGGLLQIGRLLKLNAAGQVLAVVFAVSLRMGVLQASSTQTDYVTALWLVCTAYYALLASQRALLWREWALAGAAVGLGALTKGTFYVFAAPFLAWMAWSVIRLPEQQLDAQRRSLHPGAAEANSGVRGIVVRLALSASIGAVVVLLLNAGVWWRNWNTYRSPLGPAADAQSLVNQSFGLGTVFSNTLRNLSLHVGTPYGEVNGVILRMVTVLHQWSGLDVYDPRTTFDDFRIKRSLHEDFAGNPYHLAVLGLGLAWAALDRLQGWRQVRKGGVSGVGSNVEAGGGEGFVLAWAAGFLIFSWVFKWQSTGSRLQLPWFVLAAPVTALVWQWTAGQRCQSAGWLTNLAEDGRWARLRPWLYYGIAALLLFSSLTVLLKNLSRPLLPRGEEQVSLFNRPRLQWLFTNSPEVEAGYRSLAAALLETDCRQVGLLIDSSAPEYPLWVLLGFLPGAQHSAAQDYRMEHLQAGLATQPYLPTDFQPCAVVCFGCAAQNVPAGYFLMSRHPAGLGLYYIQR